MTPQSLLDHIPGVGGVNPFFPMSTDYDLLLKKALMLDQFVLIPVLRKLKDHLENLQTYLGGVETWLVDSFANEWRFLERLVVEESSKHSLLNMEPLDSTTLSFGAKPECISKMESLELPKGHSIYLTFDIRSEANRAAVIKVLDGLRGMKAKEITEGFPLGDKEVDSERAPAAKRPNFSIHSSTTPTVERQRSPFGAASTSTAAPLFNFGQIPSASRSTAAPLFNFGKLPSASEE